jgi:long-chain acyl-CoA synthetase
MDSM